MHTIRLREPWQAAWLEKPCENDVETRLAVYRRGFHRPSGLDAGQQVSLVLRCHVAQPGVSAQLNGQSLSFESRSSEGLHAAIAELLAPVNSLQIWVPFSRVDDSSQSRPPSLSSIMQVQLAICD